MPSPNNPKKTKCNKLRYNSKEEADREISTVIVLNDSKGKKNKNKNLHSYECPECNYYHIGHHGKFTIIDGLT